MMAKLKNDLTCKLCNSASNQNQIKPSSWHIDKEFRLCYV
ncbi:unnamed protein product [marine sediment metagenome]|uniref:Uncharacterized protein n=1 Tax=marine sediment metagenome TaxID=412755 RepID=X1D154_9ZZZZ